jgi:SRSO17 transposase
VKVRKMFIVRKKRIEEKAKEEESRTSEGEKRREIRLYVTIFMNSAEENNQDRRAKQSRVE